ncbi:MAG: hypothetical protein K0M64_03295 [Rhizobium sp.]|nr:hypothetical protein [Rhizobium sp.]
MSRRTLQAGFVLAMLAVVAFALWWHGRQTPTVASAAEATVEAGKAQGDAGEASPALPAAEISPPKQASLPLPPPDAPLAQVLPDLQARADAGDHRAACRLGMELLRCQHLPTWDTLVSSSDPLDSEVEFEAEGNLAAANSVAEERLWLIERLQQCRGVPPDLQGQGARYLRQAALAGDSSAMLAYADGNHWRPDGRGTALGSDFDQWRREAPGMVHAALRAGNPTAANMLQMSYSDDFGFLSAMIPDDTYRSYVYHLLTVRLFGHRERPALARDLDAAAMERARLEADQLHERYFGGRRFNPALALRYPPYIRPHAEGPQGFCEMEP